MQASGPRSWQRAHGPRNATVFFRMATTRKSRRQKEHEAIYGRMSDGSIRRLHLFNKGKAIDKGLIVAGHYGVPLADDEILDLGDSIDVLFLAVRDKAVDMSSKEGIVQSFDPASAEFKRIQSESMKKETSYMCGPEFLVFERTTAEFYDFYCGTKPTRAMSETIYPFLPDRRRKAVQATLAAEVQTRGSFSFHVPAVRQCSTAISVPAKTVSAKVKARMIDV